MKNPSAIKWRENEKTILSYLQPALLPKTLTEIDSGREGSFPPSRPLHSISQIFLQRKKKKKNHHYSRFRQKSKAFPAFSRLFFFALSHVHIRENCLRTIWHEDIIFFCFNIPFTTVGQACNASFLMYVRRKGVKIRKPPFPAPLFSQTGNSLT